MSYINNPVTFNGYSLENVPGLTVLKTTPYKVAKRKINISDIIRTDTSIHNSADYTEKVIEVKIGINRATRALLEQSLDVLNRYLQPINKPLIIPQGSGLRKYFATFSDTDDENDGGSYIERTLMFECSDRIGYDTAATLLLNINSAYTSSARSDRLEFGGSSLWQRPTILLSFSSITGGSNATVVIGNADNGQAITITRSWTSGDIIEVGWYDSDGKYHRGVRINGVVVNFTGTVPSWNVGFGYWYYNDTFTARSFTGQINHIRAYA